MKYVKLIRAACHGAGETTLGLQSAREPNANAGKLQLRFEIIDNAGTPRGPYVPNYRDSSHSGIG